MPLYKRVYPQWYEKTWNPEAVEPVKKSKVKFEGEEGEDEGEDDDEMNSEASGH